MEVRKGRWSNLLTLEPLRRLDDASLLALRVATGTFLIHGVWDNMTEAARMVEFIEFMRTSGFPAPQFWAPFSVYTQFLAGLLILTGMLTRWAGLIVVITFVTGIVMVHWTQTLREWWPALALVVIGLVLASRGAGCYAVDEMLFRQGNARHDHA